MATGRTIGFTQQKTMFISSSERLAAVRLHVTFWAKISLATLVTDCYSGYEAQNAAAKQKCFAHLAPTARDWQKLTDKGSADFRFFDRVVKWAKKGCDYARKQASWSASTRLKHRKWIERELVWLQRLKLKHEKALTLQGRIVKHADC